MVDLYGQCAAVRINEGAEAPPVLAGDEASPPSHADDEEVSMDLSSASDTEDGDSEAASDDSAASLALRSGSFNPLHFPEEASLLNDLRLRVAQRRTTSSHVLRNLRAVVREQFPAVLNNAAEAQDEGPASVSASIAGASASSAISANPLVAADAEAVRGEDFIISKRPPQNCFFCNKIFFASSFLCAFCC